MKRMGAKGRPSLLGIVLESGSIKVVALRRSGYRYRVRGSFQAPLPLETLTDDPELAGREIQNHLAEAGIHESRCVVCVPMSWVLSLRTDVPDMPDADREDFLALQVEREMPFAPEDLSLSVSHLKSVEGTGYATVAAVPKRLLGALQLALKSAGLRPLGITVGISALHESEDRVGTGHVALLIGEENIDLEVSVGGGVASLRTLEDAFHEERDRKVLDAERLARQLRITLGQLPEAVRETIRTVQVFGHTDLAEILLEELQQPLKRLGLNIERGVDSLAERFLEADGPDRQSQPAVGAVIRYLLGKRPEFEFLAPRTSRFRQLTQRVSSRGMLWLSAAAVTLVLLGGGSFTYQYFRLTSLETRWEAIEPAVTEVEALQQQIRQYRLWFDSDVQSLRIMKDLAAAFPEEGSVWIKTLEISDLSEVHCTGYTQGEGELRAMEERLRENARVVALHEKDIRGDSPVQFALSFYWDEGAGDAE